MASVWCIQVHGLIAGWDSTHPIFKSNNALRVIKYVVILGYRYSSSSYSLVDMRVYDINVVAGLTREDPTAPNPGEPVVYDGTADGLYEVEPTPAIQAFWEEIQAGFEQIKTWWEGWWPRLHMSSSFSTPAGGTVVLHLSVDILCSLRFEDFSINTPVADQMTDEQHQAWALSVAEAAQAEGILEDSLREATELMTWIFAGLCATLAIPGFTTVVYAQSITAALLVWSIWVGCMLEAYSLGLVSVDFLCGLVGMWLYSLFGKAIVFATFVCWVSYLMIKFKKISTSQLRDWKWLGTRIIWGIISIAFQYVIAEATLYLFSSLVEISMQNYLEVTS